MPAAGGTYLDDMPPFTHYSGFAGVGAFAAAFKHVGGQCLGGFEWCSAAASAFEQLSPSVRLEGDFRQLDMAAVPVVLGGGEVGRAGHSRQLDVRAAVLPSAAPTFDWSLRAGTELRSLRARKAYASFRRTARCSGLRGSSLGLCLFQDRVFRGVSGMPRGPFPGCPGVCPGCSLVLPGSQNALNSPWLVLSALLTPHPPFIQALCYEVVRLAKKIFCVL
jgi:hypothetical protein